MKIRNHNLIFSFVATFFLFILLFKCFQLFDEIQKNDILVRNIKVVEPSNHSESLASRKVLKVNGVSSHTKEVQSLTKDNHNALKFEIDFNSNSVITYISKRYKVPHKEILIIDKYVTSYCKKYKFPKNLIYAIMIKESGFNRKETSLAHCYGLMQVNYNVWKDELRIPNKEYLFKVESNIKCGFYILNKYRKLVLKHNKSLSENNVTKAILRRYYGLGGSKTYHYASTVVGIMNHLDHL